MRQGFSICEWDGTWRTENGASGAKFFMHDDDLPERNLEGTRVWKQTRMTD